MALKSRSRKGILLPTQAVGKGILSGFSVDTPASLNPTITPGTILLPNGSEVYLVNSDFDYIGPAGDGLLTPSDITSVFFSPSAYYTATGSAVPTGNSGAIYSNLTGTKTNPDDIRLFTATTDATTITQIVPGDWYDSKIIKLGSANVGSTGDKLAGIFPGINGRAAYCYGLCAVTTTTIANDSATLSLQALDIESGAETVLGTLLVTVKTLDLDVLANVDWSELTTYQVVEPLQQLVVECTEAATSGVVDVYGLFGGFPNKIYC